MTRGENPTSHTDKKNYFSQFPPHALENTGTKRAGVEKLEERASVDCKI